MASAIGAQNENIIQFCAPKYQFCALLKDLRNFLHVILDKYFGGFCIMLRHLSIGMTERFGYHLQRHIIFQSYGRSKGMPGCMSNQPKSS